MKTYVKHYSINEREFVLDLIGRSVVRVSEWTGRSTWSAATELNSKELVDALNLICSKNKRVKFLADAYDKAYRMYKRNKANKI